MKDSGDHYAAAMYFIAGIQRGLSRIDHDSATFGDIANAMEQSIHRFPNEHKAALAIAARWMRNLEHPAEPRTMATDRPSSFC